MRIELTVCLGLSLCALAACSESPLCRGDEGCACFPNDTCNEGLSCASDFCVDLDGSRDGGLDGGPGGSTGSQAGSGARGGSNAGSGGRAGDGGSAGGAGQGGSSGSDALDGGGSGTGGSGGTIAQGDACDASAACAPLADPCRTPVCVSDQCDSARKPEGSPVADETDGDCQRVVCGAGDELATEVDSSDVPGEDGDPCTVGACEGTTPRQAPAEQGTPTPQSTQTDGDCLRVVCDGEGGLETVVDDGDVSAAPSGDLCQRRACDQGVPALEPVAPGTPCGSDLVCDASGDCVSCAPNTTSCTLSAQCCGGLCQSMQCATCPGANTADCDGLVGNGCEASLASVADCGACGNDCRGRPFVNSETCREGECAVYSCEAGRADVDGEFENGCEEIATTGPGGAYAACTTADTDACGTGEVCGRLTAPLLFTVQFNTCGAANTDCFCGYPCVVPADCPAAPSGTVTPACASGRCYLPCTVSSSTCPTGMHCAMVGVVPFPQAVCVPD